MISFSLVGIKLHRHQKWIFNDFGNPQSTKSHRTFHTVLFSVWKSLFLYKGKICMKKSEWQRCWTIELPFWYYFIQTKAFWKVINTQRQKLNWEAAIKEQTKEAQQQKADFPKLFALCKSTSVEALEIFTTSFSSPNFQLTSTPLLKSLSRHISIYHLHFIKISSSANFNTFLYVR